MIPPKIECEAIDPRDAAGGEDAPPFPALLGVEPNTKRTGRGAATKPDGATLHLWLRNGYIAVKLTPDAVRALRMDLAKCDSPVAVVAPVQLEHR